MGWPIELSEARPGQIQIMDKAWKKTSGRNAWQYTSGGYRIDLTGPRKSRPDEGFEWEIYRTSGSRPGVNLTSFGVKGLVPGDDYVGKAANAREAMVLSKAALKKVASKDVTEDVGLTEKKEPKTGTKRMFWGKEHQWTGSEWKSTKGGSKKDDGAKAKSAAPAAKDGDKPKAGAETILAKYKMKFTGPGHEKLAKAVEAGIDKAADLCKINPPVCKGNLGRKRSTMPQFPDDNVRDSFLEKMKKDGIRVSEGKMKVGHLKASQDEIQAEKTIGMAGSYLDGTFGKIKNAIVISKDGYIVDGHHRWAALLTVDPNEEMNVIRVGIPIKPLLEMVNSHDGVVKRDLKAASVGQEKKQEAVWYEKAAQLLSEGELVEMLTLLKEYGSPSFVSDPHGSKPVSPQSGYRVKPTDRMAAGRRKPKKSDRKQSFIGTGEDRYVSLSTALAEIRLANIAQGSTRGVGISPSAAPADREAGRHQNVVDGPTIKKRKPGYKPTRIGAGRLT